jgi:hypothetical protein
MRFMSVYLTYFPAKNSLVFWDTKIVPIIIF